MKILKLISLFIVLTMSSSACTTYYSISVDSYKSEDSKITDQENQVFVYRNSGAQNLMLEEEVGTKIEYMLEQEGFNVTRNFKEADIYIGYS